ASLIEARKREVEPLEIAETTKAVAPFGATHDAESPAASLDGRAESAPTTTHQSSESQAVYRSDFAAGSGHPAVGDADWIDLDDDKEVTIQTSAPAASSPAEPLGAFYAEGAAAQTPTPTTDAPQARRDETFSLFDSLEIEQYEPEAVEPAPVVATPVVESARSRADAQTQPLTYESRPSAAAPHDDLPRETGVVKADKGVSLVDGSDEDSYSIIPKGIQLRLASDDASERAASVLALSRLNTDEAFNQICAAFDDPAEEVRNAAARAIYDLNEDRADSFTRALRESPVERRRQIGAALAGSGLAEEAIGNLTGESRDKTYDAFSLLFLMAKAGEVAPLIRSIESHPDNEVRLAVVKLLALSGQHEILPSFRRLAVRGSLPTEVRSAVMEAIYQISSQPNAATPAT
ncbi:MAG TPA: HEAT repeat domain-containing protein, partial [Pyrinomonadaceae bacterium]|nr:HEAT repeat domain-containing protein [Pyrinomonadaceae bacterium]